MKDYVNSSVYFAADEAKDCVGYLQQKASYWFDSLLTNNYLDKVKKSWMSYHGNYYEESHQIGSGGETGELVNFAINHYRNLAQHMLIMVTSNRPAFQPRAINTDHKTQIQVTLAHGLLEYYMRERRLERYLKTAVEYAIVLGSGYVKLGWNSTSGQIVDYVEARPVFEGEEQPELQKDEEGAYIMDEEGNYLDIMGMPQAALKDEDDNLVDKEGNIIKNYPMYEGDVDFQNLSPYDVVFDSTKETTYEHDWVICRSFKNKYDLAAKYPELRSDILAQQTKDKLEKHRISISKLDETVDIPVYEFFHKRTEALPEGRYVIYLNDDVVLFDGPMPYRSLPVYRISPSDILGTPYGYTSMFDLLPMQDAVNSLYSTVLTNQSTFGVQNILNPRGNDIKVNQLDGGLNFIEYNQQIGKPEAMNLTQTPAEIFNFIGMIERVMETVSGVNSVARGNADVSNLRSGNSLALVQSQALQFMSGLQQSYIQLIEDVGTGLIQLLQDFAEVPRIAQIAGVSNKTKMQYFKGDDLKGINRVIVDVGNSLSQTTAGKSEMAANLLQMGLIKTPEQYYSVLNTGKLEAMTEGPNNELLLIRAENERLVDGSKPVIAIATDAHALHIQEHKNVLADPDSRLDPELVKRTLDHIQEHIQALQNVDPNLLTITFQQPLQPAVSPAPQGQQQSMSGQESANMADTMSNPEAQTLAPQLDVPEPAQVPQSPDGGPVLASEKPLTS